MNNLIITMNELFSGIGAQKSAMDRLGIDCNVVGISDIDKYANQSYYAIHGQTRQYGDISKIDHLDYADLWTYSFPCQDLSFAGKQAGIKEGTRSGLLFEVERLLERAVKDGTQPKYLLLENVKALVGKKFFPDFQGWLNRLDEMGYKNYWKVLNAKNFGVPQNRERVFVVSIRKDLNQSYEFPKEIPLTKRLKDVLETNVDEKYYLSDDKVARFIKSTELSKYPFGKEYKVLGTTSPNPTQETTNSRHWVMDTETVSPTLDATQYKTPKQFVEPLALDEQNEYIRQDGCVGTLTTDGSSPKHNNRVIEPQVKQLGNIFGRNKGGGFAGSVFDKQQLSPTLNTMQGGDRQPMITEMYNPYNKSQIKDVAPTQTTMCYHWNSSATVMIKYDNLRIRKLTPRECWRLMGFTDEEFDKAQAVGVSNSQLYKQAGNSIVVDVLEAIFRNLLINKDEFVGQGELF